MEVVGRVDWWEALGKAVSAEAKPRSVAEPNTFSAPVAKSGIIEEEDAFGREQDHHLAVLTDHLESLISPSFQQQNIEQQTTSFTARRRPLGRSFYRNHLQRRKELLCCTLVYERGQTIKWRAAG